MNSQKINHRKNRHDNRQGLSENHGARSQAEAQEYAAPAATAPGSEGSPGAPPCNTAPDNCITDQIQFLRCGIDTLELSFQGDLTLEMQDQLEALKTKAQSRDPNVQAQAQLTLGEHLFQVKPNGNGRFPYVLYDGWFYIRVSNSDSQRLPLCHVQISSELLTTSGVTDPVEELKGVVRELGAFSSILVSRADLCCDFTTEVDVESFPVRNWIRRVKHLDPHYNGDKFTGITFGRREAIKCNLYDKTEEIKVSNKNFFNQVWWLAGWDRESAVWRLEFQIFRTALKQWGINTVDNLLESLNDLWAYATHQWLRLAEPTSDQTRSRWPTSPFWAALQAVRFNSFPAEPMEKVSKSILPSDAYIFQNGIAGLTSYMATRNITDIHSAVPRFMDEANDFHAWRLVHMDKIVSLKQYAYEKARQKARRYCVPFGDEDAQ